MPLLERRAIRSFYCAYLLRSTVKKQSSYIGSTPNPRRRLAQHNGDAPGGAHHTNKSRLKPWEMVCIVAGFPSSIAALQFEWAWQNPHISTKITPDQRIASTKRKTKRGRTKFTAPKTIIARLQGLHLLLRIEAFSRWPLSMRFFAIDIYNLWNLWCQRESTSLRKGIKVVLDLCRNDVPNGQSHSSRQVPMAKERAKRRWSATGEGGVQGLDISNDYLEPHLQKSRDILHQDSDNICNICHDTFAKDYSSVVVCPHASCEHIAHITCLAGKFLQQEPTYLSREGKFLRPVLPIEGNCPGCMKETAWVDLVKELSVRTRTKGIPKQQLTKRGSTELEYDYQSEDDEGYEDDEESITGTDLVEILALLEGDQVEWGDYTDTDSTPCDNVRKVGGVQSRKFTRGGGETRGGGKTREGGKTRGKKSLSPTTKDSNEALIASDVGGKVGSVNEVYKTGKGKWRRKRKEDREGEGEGKGKQETRAKMTPQVVGEDSEMNLSFSSARDETVQYGVGPMKGRTHSRGKTAIVENIDPNSTVDEAASVNGESKIRKARKGFKKVLPTMSRNIRIDSVLSGSRVKRSSGTPKRALPTVIDSDWDGVEIIV